MSPFRLTLVSVLIFSWGCGASPAADEPYFPADSQLFGVSPLQDFNDDPGIVEVYIKASKTDGHLQELEDLEFFSYNGMFPGPTLEVNKGDRVIVHFKNELGETTTIHWHGLRIPDEMDGSPRVQDPVANDDYFTYDFVVPDAGTYWYHPHVRSHVQVERGLYGAVVVHDTDVDPSYDNERVIILDDVLIDGSGNFPAPFSEHMEAMHGRSGNYLLTNGNWSLLSEGQAEQGQVERWRIVNTANARTMSIGISGASFRVIGTDGGLLDQPYTTQRLQLPVGQRYDVEVSYDQAGLVTLDSWILVYDESIGNYVSEPFQVYGVDVVATGQTPRVIEWPEITLPQWESSRTEFITLDVVSTATGAINWRINGAANPEAPIFTFEEGETVRFAIDNLAGPEHPFHLHGQFFQIFDAEQPGLKDTVLIPGGSRVMITAKFDNPGAWMAHCHILEHAELGMMSEIYVNESP